MPKKLDLETLDLDLLLSLHKQIESRLKSLAEEKAAKLKAEMDALSPYLSVGKPSKGRVVAAKYRDPASGKTWSGRGRTPGWLAEAEKAGADRAEFAL